PQPDRAVQNGERRLRRHRLPRDGARSVGHRRRLRRRCRAVEEGGRGPGVTGRVALVTGAGSGIGRASSLAFAARGDSVVVADIDAGAANETVAPIEKDGGAAIAVGAGVTVAADAERIV